MTAELQAVQALIQRLKDEGVTVVCCGGAARDYYLGRPPKDYDFVILAYPEVDGFVENFDIRAALTTATNHKVRELGNDAEYVADDDRGLEHVFESTLEVDFGLRDVTVQFLQFTKTKQAYFAGDPQNVVDEFDCDLNKAWFEQQGERLVPRVHTEFPSPFTGNLNQFTPGLDDDRKRYIVGKFPEFKHV